MSLSSGGDEPMAPREEGESHRAEERIADPENYTLRRRQRQLHDAKESVKEMKSEAIRIEEFDRQVTVRQRDKFVAEELTDYIHELKAALSVQDRAGELLDETVKTIKNEEISLGDIAESRGQPNSEPISYRTAMRAWDVCNRYLEEISGAVFESNGLPSESNFDTTGEET